ncbi:Metallo-dependent hydrolase [Dendrothele bispora CBS 962.96]|uniref:Metallo-dependent hydrolase n=1 Tax=Dendrothele bispora (strain CBS 962.96) TaxID=1314807 RepID=A0A4S8L535_DENBC|nr:Metallo-dependent hydrolase [Dendrothele bispora CBS 962.96]
MATLPNTIWERNRKNSVPAEDFLALPAHSSTTPIVDTHTHLASTFEFYRSKYKEGKYDTVFDFVKGMYNEKKVEAIIDVWCEAPVQRLWKEFADSAINEEDRRTKWGGLEYWFVMGVHPHNAKDYDDAVEAQILEAMAHLRCVGWGEMGLDYHYDNSPRDIQQQVFARQLRHAVRLGKPLTIHTREADDDTERILKEIVPKDHPIHIHCFTDEADFGQRLLDHFPNLYIGVTGVVTFSTNLNTSSIIRRMIPSSSSSSSPSSNLRILLETDAPYMVPANIYDSLNSFKPPGVNGQTLKGRLPLSHSAMIPWTANFVVGEVTKEGQAVNVRRGFGHCKRECEESLWGLSPDNQPDEDRCASMDGTR